MRLLGILAVAGAAVLSLPGLAAAGTVTSTATTLTYDADPNTGADENFDFGVDAGQAYVESYAATISSNCTPDGDKKVFCPLPTVGFVAHLLGFNDLVDVKGPVGLLTLEAHGGAGNDDLRGTPNADKLFGDTGGDSLDGRGGGDALTGDAGDDYLYDGEGDDTATGGANNDSFTAGLGRDVYNGGDGGDSIDYRLRTGAVTVTLNDQADDGESGEGDNVVSIEDVATGSGNDTIVAGSVGVRLHGGSGNDSIKGSPEEDRLEGEEGDDTIDSRDGRFDSVDCGPGTDTLLGDPGDTSENCEIAPDRDGDGFLNEQDCQPDNPAVNPGAPEIFGNDVDEDCKDGAAYFTISVGLLFDGALKKAPLRLRWTRLVLTDIAPGDRIEITCKSKAKGCPFKSKTRTGGNSKTVSLLKLFKNRFLKVGAVVEVRIFRANQHARVHRLNVVKVKGKASVKQTKLCILVGKTTPETCPPLPA